MKDNSKVKVSGLGFQASATIGFFLVVLIIFFSVWFWFEFKIIFLGIGFTIWAVGVITALNRLDHYRHSRAMRQQD